MREESHLDDMRAAIRGDFERLAKRRGAQELMQEPTPKSEEPDEPEQAEARVPGETVEEEVPEAPIAAEPDEAMAEEEEPPAGEPPRKGFFARLLGL